MATATNEKRFAQLTAAIQKAINAIETPVKEKHVRSTIIGTFQEQSAITYWMVATRLPLQDNRIVAWKFCHVTHKLLREGHPACLDDSQRHVAMIENLGKLWVHLREGYGRLVSLYCALLVTKLKFHARNPRFPGNMSLSSDELDNIAENDVNNYFQICVELFDYMDDILNLQAAVFDSLGNARANSMTASGQCRLAALIPCAQDSSHLYDCNVKLLFRLHAALPADTLSGHRERFRGQFSKLSSFYKHASSLQYYRNLLSLPVLPPQPPNFLLQSDFGTYVAPVVSVPAPTDETDAALVDTSDTNTVISTPEYDAFDAPSTPSPQPDPVLERDRLIDHLQNELSRMRTELSQMVQERNSMLSSMREHCNRLEGQLQAAKTELEEERQKAEVLSAETPEIKEKLSKVEEKAKVTDEKFQKLKGAYTQLREEHIKLIRQKAEVDKVTASLRAAAAEHESSKLALQQQLNDRVKDVELLQQSASSSEEIEAYKSEIANLRSDLEQSRLKEVQLENLKASMETLQIEHKTATTESEEQINTLNNELAETKQNLEKINEEKEEKDRELAKVREELSGLREKSGEEYKKAVQEKETTLKQVAELTEQFQKEKQEYYSRAIDLEMELEKANLKITDMQTKFTKENETYLQEISEQNSRFEAILKNKDDEINTAIGKLDELTKLCEIYKVKYDEELQIKQLEITSLQEKIISTLEAKEKAVIEYESEKKNITSQIRAEVTEKSLIQNELAERDVTILELKTEISELKDKISEQTETLSVMQSSSCDVNQLQEQLSFYKKTNEELNNKLKDKISIEADLQSELNKLLQDKTALEEAIALKYLETRKIGEKHEKMEEILRTELNKSATEKEEFKSQIELLTQKLNEIELSNQGEVSRLNALLAESKQQKDSLKFEVDTLTEVKVQLEDELEEKNAELEIAKNELLSLNEEHDMIVNQNNSNIALKNQELRILREDIEKLTKEKHEIINEKEKNAVTFALERQVLENKIASIEKECNEYKLEKQKSEEHKEDTINKLNHEIQKLSSYYQQMTETKEKEIEILNATMEQRLVSYNRQASERDNLIKQAASSVEELKTQMDEIKNMKDTEIKRLEAVAVEKERQIEMLEGRLAHVEAEKLNAESELQDLLQHNNALEDNMATLKKQLEDAQKELERNRSQLVLCACECALEVTRGAGVALRRGDPRAAAAAGADNAAEAMQQLAHAGQVTGHETAVASACYAAAHSAAQLAAYVADVANSTADQSVAEKLTSECQTMLQTTESCLQSISSGSIPASVSEASRLVREVARQTLEADGAATTPKSVDDELADMDKAIEQAAGQIEELLKASRAGDSGVKLEVNEKILDACTTLMQAVKALVQDARKLQQEIGDPTTRANMYRRNPQWSEGLISAAKAVVFAAKLLVTSADEAISSSSRVEGVSAAAHEVASATAQLVAASRARAPPAAPALARLAAASRAVAHAAAGLVAVVKHAATLTHEHNALDTSTLTLTATRRLEMDSKVRALELETALEAERAKLAALRKRHYMLAQSEENGGITNGNEN